MWAAIYKHKEKWVLLLHIIISQNYFHGSDVHFIVLHVVCIKYVIVLEVNVKQGQKEVQCWSESQLWLTIAYCTLYESSKCLNSNSTLVYLKRNIFMCDTFVDICHVTSYTFIHRAENKNNGKTLSFRPASPIPQWTFSVYILSVWFNILSKIAASHMQVLPVCVCVCSQPAEVH